MRKLFFRLFLMWALVVSLKTPLRSQLIYEHMSHASIYEYLDEMANLKIIQLNDVVKPYSREMIYDKLLEVKNNPDLSRLTNRQKKELEFYLQGFETEGDFPFTSSRQTDLFKKNHHLSTSWNPLGLFYQDSLFTLGLQPILGYRYAANSNGALTHSHGGAALLGYVGEHLGFYGNLRDNNENRLMIQPDYLVQQQGVPVKNFGDEGIDYSEARGGLMASWKWGGVGIVKDHVQWGLGYNGANIQSGRTPSFAMIKLEIKPVRWFEFNYFHGWLVSEVVDSANSYTTNGVYRPVYYPKYMASNMFTFFPIRNLNISVGNSIIYSVNGGPHLAYLVPFLFFKSVDHTLNATNADGETGQNAQMFLNISSRNLKHLHLYFSLFVDELSIGRFNDPGRHNFFSYKAGFRLSSFPIQNIDFTFEFTHTNPLTYQHKIETTTYASNQYNMGHYLGDNSRELYLAISYKPLRGLFLELAWSIAQHGDDYNYADCANDPDCTLDELPILENIIWENSRFLFQARYEFAYNVYAFTGLDIQQITADQTAIEKYSPEFYRGNTNTFNLGFAIGF